MTIIIPITTSFMLEQLNNDTILDDITAGWILEEYNIKIVAYHGNYLAYYGIKIGLGRMGTTKKDALREFLVNSGVPFTDVESFTTEMNLRFK